MENNTETILNKVEQFKKLYEEHLHDYYKTNFPKGYEDLFKQDCDITVHYGQSYAKLTNNRGVLAFVALKDNQTKNMGKVKEGEIFKPASFKTPARIARGSVYNEDMMSCVNRGHVDYLR